jgi:AMP phosphorylase
MKLIVKDVDIETGRQLLAIMNKEDARKLDIFPGDRIKIIKGKKEAVAVVDFSVNPEKLRAGEIGVFEELLKKISLKEGDEVSISVADKPASTYFIRKKMEGEPLSFDEIKAIIEDIIEDRLTDIELTYFVGATFTKGMSMDETVDLTRAMVETGTKIKLDYYPVIDKHCVGGVPGNRTTPIIVSIVTASGLVMPKTSSRAITSPAGTADALEVLMNVEMSKEKMLNVVKETNGCMVWGGGEINLAPADDIIIQIERPLSVDAESQLLASILAKKLSVSSTHVLIDIPVGKTAKIESMDKAKHLKEQFLKIAKIFKLNMQVIITDGSQPIGNGIGPALEAKDILLVLKNDSRAPKKLEEKSVMMAGIILEMGGKAKKGQGEKMAYHILKSGKAFDKMKQIIKAQGQKCIDPDDIGEAPFKYDCVSDKDGKVDIIDNKAMAKVARMAGAPFNKKAGIFLHKHVGESVREGEKLFTIYAESAQKLKYAWEAFDKTDGFVVK